MEQIYQNKEPSGKCLQFCKNIIKSPDKKIIAFFDKIKNKKIQQQEVQNNQKGFNFDRVQNTQRNSVNNSQKLNLFHNFLKKKQPNNSKEIKQKNQGFCDVGSQYGDHDYDNDLEDFIKYPKGIKNKQKFKNNVRGSLTKIPLNIENNFKSQISRSITAQTGNSDLNIQISKIRLKQKSKNAKIQSQKSLFSNIDQPLQQQKKTINEKNDDSRNQNKISSRKQPSYINSAYFKQIKNNFGFLKQTKMKTQISTPKPYSQNQHEQIIPKLNVNGIFSRQHQRTKTQNNLEEVFLDYEKLKSYRKNQRKELKLNLKELMISPQTKNCSRPFYNYQSESPRFIKTPNILKSGQKHSNLLFNRIKAQMSPKQRNQALSSMTSHQKTRKNQTQSINVIKQKFQQISESGNNYCGFNSPKNQTGYKNVTNRGFQNMINNIQKTRYCPLFEQQEQYCQIKYNGIKFKTKIIKSNADILLKKFKNNKVKVMDKNYLSLQKMKKTRNVAIVNN